MPIKANLDVGQGWKVAAVDRKDEHLEVQSSSTSGTRLQSLRSYNVFSVLCSFPEALQLHPRQMPPAAVL